MRTKTLARRRCSKSSRQSVSASTTTRPLPSPIPDHSSNDEEEEKSTDMMDLSENEGRESHLSSSDSSDVEIVNTCLKCNKDGKLLICCGTGCAICLHEECIPCKPKYGAEGDFYCPYCWYKIHQARAQEFKKMALLAKKSLRDFMDSKPAEEVGNDKVKQNDARTNNNDSNVEQVMRERRKNCYEHLNKMGANTELQENVRHNDKNVKLSGAEGIQSTVAADNEEISETFEFEVLNNDESMGQEKDNEQVVGELNAEILQDEKQADGRHTEAKTIVDGTLHRSADVETEALDTSKGNQVREEKEEETRKDASANVSGEGAASDAPILCDSDNETLAMRQNFSKQRSNQNADSPKKSSPYPDNTSAEKARNQKEEVSPLKVSRQPQAPAKKLKNLSFPHEKRKRLHWKPEEEEMLREGVQKFSTKVNKNLPWRKILEFGHHVFDGSRTPADLKDKWRNIVPKDTSGISGRSS